ncbi:MAG: hypothetical protein N2322_03435, partial [Terrimicrobiaceae bacterium]|nr:hypothetical protein [Terrimicrobiaceae bacterium]
MRRRAILAGLVAAAGAGGCGRHREPPPPPEVTVAAIEQREVIARRTWVGLLNGYQNADIRAQVTGYL